MKLRGVWLALLIVMMTFAWVDPVFAQERDTSQADTDETLTGERFTIVVEVETEPGATVEIDPLAESWNGVELIQLVNVETTEESDYELHRLELVVAAFLPGTTEVVPVVSVIDDGVVTSRELPALPLTVVPSLPADAPAQLAGNPAPLPIAGGRSPLLTPAIVLGATAVAVLLGWIAWRFIRRYLERRRAHRRGAMSPPEPPTPMLPTPQAMASDPGIAYRKIAAVVRNALGEQYAFPAPALTTAELAHRMPLEGVDRWQARLVSGLLENCDAVVYAGFDPAEDRKRADLNIAEEILEGFV